MGITSVASSDQHVRYTHIDVRRGLANKERFSKIGINVHAQGGSALDSALSSYRSPLHVDMYPGTWLVCHISVRTPVVLWTVPGSA